MMPPEWSVVARIMVQERMAAEFSDAERASIAAGAPFVGMSRFAAVRRQMGAAMVRAGERLQGRQRPDVAADRPHGAPIHSAR